MADVRGTAGMVDQASKGMQLFAMEEVEAIVCDQDAATAFKSGVDKQIEDLNEMIKTLSGKENLKLRKEKSKEVSSLSNTDQYIDAVRVLKGQEPKHGHFIKSGGAPKSAKPTEASPAEVAPEEKKAVEKKAADKKPKKEESAGISKAERDELEKLKTQIVELKTQLKADGLSGGQINKDERVATMVARMNELKEKECPGSTTAKKDDKADGKKKKALSADQEAAVRKLTEEIEIYRAKLQTEFKYSKKEIASDPDMVEMSAELNKLLGKK